MTPPIVIAAFGTSTKAMDTYDKMSAVIESQLPGHEIYWAFTSRYVMNRLKKRKAAKIYVLFKGICEISTLETLMMPLSVSLTA